MQIIITVIINSIDKHVYHYVLQMDEDKSIFFDLPLSLQVSIIIVIVNPQW